MRARFLILALLALTLAACGSANNSNNSGSVGGGQQVAVGTAPTAAPNSNSSGDAAVKKAIAAAAVYPAAVHVKTRSGKGLGVVLLPDTGNEARAAAEAKKLATLGVTAIVVNGPANAPTQAAAFERAVSEARAAVDTLRKRPGIDPLRVGLVGEGVGAHVGAVAMGRAPRTVAAAVLADIGGVVVSSRSFAPERWLKRTLGTDLLFQRDLAKRGMTTAEVKRLILASPPGTLMEQYKQLGANAEAARDKWIRDHLVAR